MTVREGDRNEKMRIRRERIDTHNVYEHSIFTLCANFCFLASLFSADIISTVEFNHDGEFLATGDKGGRVVIFQRDGTKMRVKLSLTSTMHVFQS